MEIDLVSRIESAWWCGCLDVVLMMRDGGAFDMAFWAVSARHGTGEGRSIFFSFVFLRIQLHRKTTTISIEPYICDWR